ncbi:MAG: hypothetical protein NTW86_04735 [Candidatus Sumerlaeota bacterium]|nr:hypothetical protein [Candidatus Sumerlaeota bacterium]
MIATSKLTRKNQTTVPKAVLKALGAQPSDELVYDIEPGKIVLRARTGRLADLAQMPPAGPKPPRPLTIQAMKKAAQEAAAESVLRSLRRPRAR